MKTKVRVSPQVEAFVKSRALEPRRMLTRAIKGLAKNSGNIRNLEGALAGFRRLRVGGYRVLFAERFEGGVRYIDCIFAETRSVVYEMAEKLLAEKLGGG